MKAFHGCRVFSHGLQAKCDSLAYSFQDSVIRLYRAPVLWADENQLTADSMAVFTKNKQTDRLELFSSAFVTSQIDSIRFNQIKGRSLTGYFKNNELYKIDIKGNGESIYYLPGWRQSFRGKPVEMHQYRSLCNRRQDNGNIRIPGTGRDNRSTGAKNA